MRAVDFFCGAGGLTRGLLDARIRVVAGLDAEDRCKDAYEKNNGVPFVHARVQDVGRDTPGLAEHFRRTDDLTSLPVRRASRSARFCRTAERPRIPRC